MTHAKGFSISLLLAAAVLSQSALAAEQIHQRATDSGSVELSNLDEPGPGATVVPVAKAPATSTPAAAAPAAPAAKPVVAKGSKRKSVADTTDSENADAASDESTQAADATELAPERAANEAAPDRQQAQALTPPLDNPAMPAGNGTYAGNAGGYAGGTAAGAPGAAADPGAAAAGSGTSTAAADPTATTPAKPYTPPVITAPPGFDPTVAAQLASYRALMLQEASYTTLTNTNPAISRRYLAVDRVTYQARTAK